MLIRGVSKCAAAAVVGGIILSSAPLPVGAQPTPELQSQIQNAFQQLLRDPGNVELTYRYAQLQVQAGNFEAAAGALERLLLLQPNDPRLKVELGVLYLRMGSTQAALTYLREAAAEPNLPPEVSERLEIYMREAERRTRRHQFYGEITIGMRYDSNANLATSSGLNLPPGVVATVPGPRSDWAGIAIARATHIFDFNTNDNTAWVSTLSGYGTRQVTLGTENITFGEMTTGPRFHPFPNLYPSATARPHLIANALGLDDRFYSWTIGGGFDLTMPVTERLTLDVTYQYRSVDYDNISTRPTASDLTGTENALRLRGLYQFGAAGALFSEISARFVNTRVSSQDYQEYGATIGYSREYSVGLPRRWQATAYATYYYRPYRAPDPTVDPNTAHRENEVRFGFSNLVPIVSSVSLVQQVDYLKTMARPSFYDRDNVSVTLGAVWQF